MGFSSGADRSRSLAAGVTDPNVWAERKAQANREETAKREADDAAAAKAAIADEQRRRAAELKPRYVRLDNARGSQFVMMKRAMDALRGRLRDPESAKFQNVYLHNGAADVTVTCGEVNAKNGFGGYNGVERFMSNGGTISVMATDFKSPREFEKAWKLLCD